MTTLTASDIAKYIQRPGEPLTAAVDRLRTWTKMGIIKPKGESHPGTGRKKRYSSNTALPEAVLLQTLVDTFGSPAASLSPLIANISRLASIGTGMIAPPDQTMLTTMLVISRSRDGSGTITSMEPKDLEKYISHFDRDVYVVINIKRLFGSLPFDWKEFVRELQRRAKSPSRHWSQELKSGAKKPKSKSLKGS